ncbi:M24 family metallopeptidase, partial [Streptococcus suis]
ESRDAFSEIAKRIKDDKFETLGFDSEVSYSLYQTLSQVFEGYKLQATSNVIESLRMVKDEHEVAIIKKACQISDQAFLDVLDFIKPNVTTELEVANFLDFRMRELGASGPSFEFIVASGERSSMPHGVASHKVIRDNEMLTMDFGCYYQHYVSDMT